MSALGSALADYLALRRALGYQLEAAGRVLPRFVAYLDAHGAEIVTTSLALAWSTEAGTGGEAARRLQAVRGFARYLQALDPANEVPPTGLVPDRRRRVAPHLYSDTEIVALMSAAGQLDPPLRAATTQTVIGLLAATGMRIGEVLALNVADIDWDTGVVTVRLTKFNKSRHVPLAPSTLTALAAYRQVRQRLAPQATTAALFVAPAGQRLSYQAFRAAFNRLIATGIVSGPNRPRIHGFRHSFAVRTLLGWYRDGADVHALLPRLSTYLGHVDPTKGSQTFSA